jgi:sialate O-acetylesterase
VPIRAFFVFAIAMLASIANADVHPDDLCADGMVLQRNTDARIFGTADANEKITVNLRDHSSSTVADGKGKWQIKIPTGDAAAALPMTIAGKNVLHYANVAVGEVWYCAGQSNMEARVSGDPRDQKLAADACPNPSLRYYGFAALPNYHPKWVPAANPKAVDWYSTVAYFYGLELQRKLKVPVGLVTAVAGGIPIESWISWDVLQHDPVVGIPKWQNGFGQCFGLNVLPCAPYTIRGAIWYQGESNCKNGYRYRGLFSLMARNWRETWDQGDFPIYFVQIAPYRPVSKEPQDSAMAELRESQRFSRHHPRCR